ncbi:MAG: sugar transferase [Tessaracoccus sp.]|nr:sugar transferase [Tessaracoccus sp.]
MDLRAGASRLDTAGWTATLTQGRAKHRRIVGVLADASVIFIAAVAAHALRFEFLNEAAPELPLWLMLLVPVAWLGTLALAGAYSNLNLQTGPVEFQRIMLASVIFAGTIGTINYLVQYDLSRAFFLLTFAIGVPALLTLRYTRRLVLKRLHAAGHQRNSAIIAGSPAHIDEVARVLRREKWLGYEMVGAVTTADITETPSGLQVLGTVKDVVELVERSGIQTVIFAEGSFPDSQHFKRMAWELEEHSAQMIVAPALSDISASRLATRPVGGLPLMYVERPQALNASRWAKRLFDIVGSGILLLVAGPIIAIVALLIKLEDRGPIFFQQTRVGRRGEEFQCLKVRSMVVDAEARKAELEAQNESEGKVLFKMARDPRITRVGAFIRRFSIDELPQLWNVFRGDMSLVGPRPALPKEVALYDRDAERRLDVRPGLTGLWQVSGRSDLPWDETVRLDAYYVDNWSFMQDLTIMLRTARAVVSSRGAY